ncbi:LPD29 domain-containing protein [Erwinia psidii]|uniref:LPD29 domain-containing protein n=1 Tax=Erwinia psidii TaxID=69224 RepID=UPI00226B75E7|nr:LPD29 domain-containing protein [Erwinia psidii]
MTTLKVGQCLTSFNNEYVVSTVKLADGKISYTILGLNAPTSAPLLETSLRFYQVIDKTLSLDELRARRQVVQSVTDQREARHQAKEAARQLANERASTDPENVELLTTATERNTTKLAAKNIRILLKKNFPGVKFSVRMRDYNALYVSWTDGPTKEAVEGITNKFEEGSVNTIEDIYEYNITGFHRVYGGVKYLFYSRDLTDALIAESIELLRKEYKFSS